MSLTSHLPMRLRLLATAVVLAVSAACGSTGPNAVPIEQTVFADSLHIDLARFTKLPSGMYVRDSIVGTGTEFVSGHVVGVHYVGSFADGRVFDRNLVPQTPLSFTLGAGRVIPGFDIGLQGMKVGGKRQIIIPPELGYGGNEVNGIPGYSVLLFTVDAVSTL